MLEPLWQETAAYTVATDRVCSPGPDEIVAAQPDGQLAHTTL